MDGKVICNRMKKKGEGKAVFKCDKLIRLDGWQGYLPKGGRLIGWGTQPFNLTRETFELEIPQGNTNSKTNSILIQIQPQFLTRAGSSSKLCSSALSISKIGEEMQSYMYNVFVFAYFHLCNCVCVFSFVYLYSCICTLELAPGS